MYSEGFLKLHFKKSNILDYFERYKVSAMKLKDKWRYKTLVNFHRRRNFGRKILNWKQKNKTEASYIEHLV